MVQFSPRWFYARVVWIRQLVPIHFFILVFERNRASNGDRLNVVFLVQVPTMDYWFHDRNASPALGNHTVNVNILRRAWLVPVILTLTVDHTVPESEPVGCPPIPVEVHMFDECFHLDLI